MLYMPPMKRITTCWMLACGLFAVTTDRLPASVGDETAPASPVPTSPADPSAGFWPTDAMVESVLRRWAAEAAERYDLRPDQQREVERRLVDRWTGFLEENRADIQPLLNEYIEARLAMEPPSADAVADWAARAMPVFQRLKGNVEEGEQEVHELLNADQRARFEQRRTQRQFGLQFVEGQLKRWSVGNFKEREWWDPPAGYRAQQRRRLAADAADDQPRADDDAPVEPPARITNELAAWEQYVADFCDRYELDQAQRNAAESMLRELVDRARDHVYRHRERIAALEKKIVTGSGADDAAFDGELTELYGPLDAMFEELERRLQQLPTSAQRRRAEQPEAEGEAGGEGGVEAPAESAPPQ